ncbi:family 5 carbohydrate esterase, partial [Cryphonectria parasitica EP155]
VLAGVIATATAQNSTTNNTACVTGNAVHMIVARASLEPPGTGIIGEVATQVQQQFPGSDIVPVVYPATLDNYPSSENDGVVAMTQLVTDYAARCPDSKIVLMGYSQGAQVTADVLCGRTDGPYFNTTQPLASSISSQVTAAVLMGDPSKSTNETFLAGTSTKNGIFPREVPAGCDPVADRMVSYCNANDTYCDSGSSLDVHLSYVQDNGTSAVNFIVDQINAGAGGSNGT